MSLQIDIKKPQEGYSTCDVNIYIDGECFVLKASGQTVEDLARAGVVKQTKRMLRNEQTGKIEEFEYEEGCDGMGVKYTSAEYELKHKLPS